MARVPSFVHHLFSRNTQFLENVPNLARSRPCEPLLGDDPQVQDGELEAVSANRKSGLVMPETIEFADHPWFIGG